MEWQSEVESSLSQFLHPFSIEGRMECIDYFNANSLSVIELFNSKLQINDFSDTSNTVFVEKRFIVGLRPRCKWDSVEIVSWWRLLSEILYLYLFFFFFPPQEGHLWKFPFLGQCTGNIPQKSHECWPELILYWSPWPKLIVFSPATRSQT